jgi:hypothetical protein
MQYACGSLVCTPGSKLGQMAHQRKGGTTLKVGVPPMQLERSLSDLAIYHSLRNGMREAQLDEVISAF